jgi:hypothetical protein
MFLIRLKLLKGLRKGSAKRNAPQGYMQYVPIRKESYKALMKEIDQTYKSYKYNYACVESFHGFHYISSSKPFGDMKNIDDILVSVSKDFYSGNIKLTPLNYPIQN